MKFLRALNHGVKGAILIRDIAARYARVKSWG